MAKNSMTNDLLDVDDGSSCLKVAGDLQNEKGQEQQEKKINLAINEDGDAAVHEKGNLGVDGNLANDTKKRKKEPAHDNHPSNETTQIKVNQQSPVDGPDRDLNSRKQKKMKHEFHEKKLENASSTSQDQESVDGQSDVKSTVKRRDSEGSGCSKGEKKKHIKNIGNNSEEPETKVKSKKVRFSGHVEVFPSSKTDNEKPKTQEDGLVHGKRFTPEEDELVRQAVFSYIKRHNLGEDGITKVLNCQSYGLKNTCWREIGACIPYRPEKTIYYRAHVLFERAETSKWTKEETEFLQKSYKQHGNKWKMVADELGKHRLHVKDKWRRIKRLESTKKGKWSQEEYQGLYDLVNLNLQMKDELQVKKSKHGMLRDNIPWGTISNRLSTRTDLSCCHKWYKQLTSSLVAEDKWSNADDYRLVSALYDLDAACVEDVDWDRLLEHRPGDVCRKRWDQMVLHIGEHGSQPFSEQIEVLSKRYCPELAETRAAWDSKPVVP